MKEYLVKTWSEDGTFTMQIVSQCAIWNVIDDAKSKGTQISVHELGGCVLDWS